MSPDRGLQRAPLNQSCGLLQRRFCHNHFHGTRLCVTRAVAETERHGAMAEQVYTRSMMREYDVVVERDSEGYYIASVPALRGCHTQARSLDELMARIQEAIELCLDVEGDAGAPLDFIGVQRVRISA